ncbi:DNA-binding transcriptional regulator, XRE-family HTH domain [Desulfatibacillum alkenivorans DSM 16219]|jgi:transcriptional regulator with XRE-family HTH domain|uniref:DNA-binding transcriptional regulator, XRE-family HTH domain n=1 Tax=Desulfatibacillum alkenivorans DSM 16219 TaxID=1121393 RepID=A0A1M6UHJ3_9BACT|nr:helix-turn-helix transcriptional regulator [Desulfatibacillum alkenivorans]SHK68631.1 DNA-binding transcriptional regulator, XRE-family HTH domain [Desulfatibacillum alkenivorans DSM 16219]
MDIENVKKQLGLRLKALRLERGLRQEDMEKWDFSYRYYGRLERGLVNPTVDTLLRLCQIFDVELIDLFGFMDDQGEISDDQAVVTMKMNEIVKSGDAERIRKLRVFLEEIL